MASPGGNFACASWLGLHGRDTAFWFFIRGAQVAKSQVAVKYARSGTGSFELEAGSVVSWWQADKLEVWSASGGTWCKVAGWSAAGDDSWVQACLVNGVEVARLVGPKESEILPMVAAGSTPQCDQDDSTLDDHVTALNHRMFEQESHKDITFVFDDGEERAHKAVLAAASDAFAAMFASSMQETISGRIDYKTHPVQPS